MADILKGLRFLKENQLLVGIPQAASSRDGDLSNVELAYLHSQGSPINNVPARPFLEPALDKPETQQRMAAMMKQAVIAALDGDEGSALDAMHKAGQYGENAAKKYFRSGGLAANAPITIEGGWMKNKKSGKTFKVKGKGSAVPLIDTGSLRSSITHVIEKR